MFFNSVAVDLSKSNIFYYVCREFQSMQEKQFLYKEIVRANKELIMAEIGSISLLSLKISTKIYYKNNYDQIS